MHLSLAQTERTPTAPGGSRDVVLRLDRIRKRFGSLIANDDISIELKCGEVLALLGENGAGKTTLMNILFGHYVADGGSIEVFGQDLPSGSPRAAIDAGVGMVHQHFTLADNLSVLDNVILGTRPLYLPFMQQAQSLRKLEEVCRRTGLKVDPRRLVRDLAVGERQRVEILKALYRGARILILDEPTAVLTPQETDQLFETIRELVSGGMSVIFISHKLDEVMRISDRVVVLRNGRAVFDVRTAETNLHKLAHEMVGREVPMPKAFSRELGGTVLKLVEVSLVGPGGKMRLDDANLGLRQHEILGVAGVSGNGQQALFQVISGLARADSGTVEILGEQVRSPKPGVLAEKGVARIPEDRHSDGLMVDMTIWENLISERYRSPEFQWRGILKRAAALARARQAIEEFDIRCSSPEAVARLLSGGNMQKLILARTLSYSPGLIVANQPTRGLDVGAVSFVHDRLIEAKTRGAGVLLISEDLDELLQLSDRLVVMFDGKVSAPMQRDEASIKSLGVMMAGDLGAPRHAL